MHLRSMQQIAPVPAEVKAAWQLTEMKENPSVLMPWAGVHIDEADREPPPFEEVVDMIKELRGPDVPIPGRRVDPPTRGATGLRIIRVGRRGGGEVREDTTETRDLTDEQVLPSPSTRRGRPPKLILKNQPFSKR